MSLAVTRIKMCGLTRAEDVRAAVAAGADAIGFVFYPPSPRYVTPAQAAELLRAIPPFVSSVGLFVNADSDEVRATLAAVPLDLLQFHGDAEIETDAYCSQFGRPFLKAAAVRPGVLAAEGGNEDLLQYAASYPSARALLLDAFVDGYGGGGKVFDWTLIPPSMMAQVVLSGGLDAANVGEAIRRVRPLAVDVSSGIEAGKGIKDAAKMQAFARAVREADAE
jgi:phosphoribosylanthranilate isomerase